MAQTDDDLRRMVRGERPGTSTVPLSLDDAQTLALACRKVEDLLNVSELACVRKVEKQIASQRVNFG